MAETQTKTLSKPQKMNIPTPPLKLYENIYCLQCQHSKLCTPPEKLQCTLTLIADELARLRQTIQQRTQHLSW